MMHSLLTRSIPGKRIKIYQTIGLVGTILGSLGMVLCYRGALSPTIAPRLTGGTFPIGKMLDGSVITMDILSAAKLGPLFLTCGLIWVLGAAAIRILLGWGPLTVESRRYKALGLAGGLFQLLGSFIFLYSAYIMISTFQSVEGGIERNPEDITINYGLTLRGTLSGLTVFALGNIMTAFFIKYATEFLSENAPPPKRKITAILGFVPLLIAIAALINGLILECNPAPENGLTLAAMIVGFALPAMVGSIPLLINSLSIPQR